MRFLNKNQENNQNLGVSSDLLPFIFNTSYLRKSLTFI